MVIQRLAFTVILAFSVYVVAFGGAMVTQAFGRATLLETAVPGNRDASPNLSQTLREAMRANLPLYSIDVSYTRRRVIPAEVHATSIEAMKRLFLEKAKERGFSNLEFRPPGVVNTANEYIVFTSERVRIEGPSRLRTEITYFADDSPTSTKTREIVNMYRDGVFHHINRTQRTIAIYDEPHFEGTGGTPMLYAGKLSGDLKVVAVIALASEPNSASVATGRRAIRKSCRHVGAVEIAGMSAVQIECGDADGSKKDYELLLDPNDLGRCFRITRYDRETQRVAESREFSEFRPLKGPDSLYPRIMTHRKYSPEGDVIEAETIVISDIVTGVKMSDQEFDLGSYESLGYQITDYRSSPPIDSGGNRQR